VKLDSATKRVIVGPKTALLTHRLLLRDVNWLGDEPLGDLNREINLLVRVRSTAAPVAARLSVDPSAGVMVDLEGGEEGIAPGQACVFYAAHGARVLGGGFIVKALPERFEIGNYEMGQEARR
jgi:tRNA-specific 2-thiouridylase